MELNFNRLIPEKKCAKCGKVFIVAPQHVFKVYDKEHTKYYCSWTCYNHRNDKEKENERSDETDTESENT